MVLLVMVLLQVHTSPDSGECHYSLSLARLSNACVLGRPSENSTAQRPTAALAAFNSVWWSFAGAVWKSRPSSKPLPCRRMILFTVGSYAVPGWWLMVKLLYIPTIQTQTPQESNGQSKGVTTEAYRVKNLRIRPLFRGKMQEDACIHHPVVPRRVYLFRTLIVHKGKTSGSTVRLETLKAGPENGTTAPTESQLEGNSPSCAITPPPVAITPAGTKSPLAVPRLRFLYLPLRPQSPFTLRPSLRANMQAAAGRRGEGHAAVGAGDFLERRTSL
ncbi:hypothetical protein C8R43DRAFT_952692 [Mycena crocata]|nr:hypothetical protein C8R43DRAFT_952692 [Mycena crocata]